MSRVSVLGSDIDRASLDAASRATYLPASFADTEPPRNATFDLITRRNVLIYPDRASHEGLLDTLYDALRPDGYLALGRVARLFGKARGHLMPVDVRERLYRKPL